MKKISLKQLEANRQNAKLGGVKTEAGKAIVKFNALKHGILSKENILKNENKRAFNEHAESLKQTLLPANAIEMFLVEKITIDTWRLKRALRIETEMMQNGLKQESSNFNFIDEESNLGKVVGRSLDSYGKLTRYITAIERSIHRDLHEIQRLQAQRRGKDVPLPFIIDVDVNKED